MKEYLVLFNVYAYYEKRVLANQDRGGYGSTGRS